MAFVFDDFLSNHRTLMLFNHFSIGNNQVKWIFSKKNNHQYYYQVIKIIRIYFYFESQF